jgi:hypothetical protein
MERFSTFIGRIFPPKNSSSQLFIYWPKFPPQTFFFLLKNFRFKLSGG